MSNSNFDTRFFVEHYYSRGPNARQTTDVIVRSSNRFVSAIVVSEVYKLALVQEGRDTAKLRVQLLVKDFEVVDVDKDLAIQAAELRHKYAIPLADQIIAATSIKLKATCYTDDPHLLKVREVHTRWIQVGFEVAGRIKVARNVRDVCLGKGYGKNLMSTASSILILASEGTALTSFSPCQQFDTVASKFD